MTRSEFVLRSAIFIALALAPFLIWLLFNVIVLATGAVLVATLIHLVATPFLKIRLPRGVALALSGLLIASIIGGTFYLFGRTMAGEFHDVLRRAEQTADAISLEITRSGLSDYLPSSFAENISLSGLIGRSFTVSIEAVLGALVAFFAGVFIASEPALYSEGFTLLFAPRWRHRARETLGHVSTALRRWLLGQMIEMVTMGVMAGVAVWLIGLPSRLAPYRGSRNSFPISGRFWRSFLRWRSRRRSGPIRCFGRSSPISPFISSTAI
jgi:predicted PurR-regulated permease PerM